MRRLEELPWHQRAVRLAALDRERRLAAAAVTANELEPGSDHAVEHGRIDLGLAQRAGAGDKRFPGLEVGERLGARGVPGEQRCGGGDDAPDPVEAAGG